MDIPAARVERQNLMSFDGDNVENVASLELVGETDEDGPELEFASIPTLPSESYNGTLWAITTHKTLKSVDFKPSGMSTEEYSGPDSKKWKRTSRVSFVNFDLNFIRESDNVIDSAPLYLYMVRSKSDLEGVDELRCNVSVHALQRSSKDNRSGSSSLSHEEPQNSEGNSFVAESSGTFPLDHGFKIKLCRVDVMSAIDDSRMDVTFKIATSSDVSLDFGGRTQDDRGAFPHMRVMFSAPLGHG